MSVHTTSVVITSLMAFCACSNDINVRSEWGSGMAQYGLTPVYPLRENVYVGDIYLVVHNPCENSNTKIMQMVLLGSIPEAQLADAFRKFYGDRPEFPPTSPKPKLAAPARPSAGAAPSKVTANLTATGPGSATISLNPASASPASTATSAATTPAATASQPTAGTDDPIFSPANKPRSFDRLRLAAFPDFSLGSSTRFDAGAGGLIGAFNAAVGIGGGKTSHLNVSVSGVEEAVTPAPVLTRAIRSFLPTSQAEDILDTSTIGKLIDTLETQIEQEPGCGTQVPKKATINFVNRVFYARTVTFDFGQMIRLGHWFALRPPQRRLVEAQRHRRRVLLRRQARPQVARHRQHPQAIQMQQHWRRSRRRFQISSVPVPLEQRYRMGSPQAATLH